MEQEKSELIPLSTKAKQNALQSLYPSESGSQTEIFLNTDYFSYMSLCVLLWSTRYLLQHNDWSWYLVNKVKLRMLVLALINQTKDLDRLNFDYLYWFCHICDQRSKMMVYADLKGEVWMHWKDEARSSFNILLWTKMLTGCKNLMVSQLTAKRASW